jgi:hypothetical protein
MKHIALLLLVALAALGMGPHHADLSGTWKMNIAKSKNLPASFKNLQSYTLTVEQSPDADSLTVAVGFEGSGQKVSLPPTVYGFDGKERYREDTLRGSKRWTTASWTTTGQKLIVTSRVILTKPKESRYTETGIWDLRSSKMLEIHVTQKFEGSDSTNSELRVFRRAVE